MVDESTETFQLCWSCEKACGGCSWSDKLVPIKGWTAEPTKIKRFTAHSGETILGDSYFITACPLYVCDCDDINADRSKTDTAS